MVSCEHFIYGLFPEAGYQFRRTPNLLKQVSKANLNYLMHLGDRQPGEATLQIWLPDECLLAVTYLKPVSDGFGRQGSWNHTILIRLDEYLQLTHPTSLFSPYFIKDPSTAPTTLTPLTLS